MRHDVLVFPDYRVANPYQTLLYANVDSGFNVQITADWQAALAQAADPIIFHLHWEDAIYRMAPDIDAAHARAVAFVEAIDALKRRGGQFLWTIHNVRPHDGRYLAVHDALREALLPLADLILVHHPEALRIMREELDLPPAGCTVLPHGNYCAVYPRLGPGRKERRAAAGFEADARVLLLFGRLDSYKGARNLLEAMARIDDPRLRLLIAGKAVDDPAALLDALPAAVRGRIDYRPGFVEPKEVAPLFDLADMVAAPYSAILTSGTAMLALSLGRPVLAPSLPGLREWLEDGANALLYAQSEPDGLEQAIERMLALSTPDLEQLGARALETAHRHPWEPVHHLLNGLYARCVLNRHIPRLVGSQGWYRLD